MNDFMKILLIIVALYGGWKFFGPSSSSSGGDDAQSGPQAMSSRSAESPRGGKSTGAGARARKDGPTKADVARAQNNVTLASQRLVAMQNTKAPAGTQDRKVEYHGDYRHTHTLTIDNSAVGERSAAIKAATLEMQEAQRVYAEVYRAWKAAGGK